MSEDSRHVDLTVTSESEPDGHPADDMIISKAAKRVAVKRQAASIVDADASAAEQSQQQPRKKSKRKKRSSPATDETATGSDTLVDKPSPTDAQPQRAAPHAGGKALSARPRKTSAAAMLSPDNAQQLQRQPPAVTPSPGAPTSVQPPPGLDTAVQTVRPEPEDAAVLRTPAPLGVIVVDDDDTPAPNSVQRLLRAPRYFDEEGFENAAMRCYRCGGSGHKAQDCINEAKARPCALCAQFGHSKANCPSLVCFKCNRTGHISRDCTYSYNSRVADAASAVCLRCGLSSCRGAHADWARAEGACTTRYSAADVALAVCFVCGRRGHLCCASTPAATYRPSCYNCGEGGHTAVDCRRDKPIAVRNERQPGYTERSVSASYYGYDDDYNGYSGYGNGGFGGGSGSSSIKCYACGETGHMARDCPNQQSRSKDRGRSRFAAPADSNGRQWRQTQLPSWQHDRR